MRLEPPSWWYGDSLPLAAWGLFPLSLIYGNAVRARFRHTKPYRSKLPVLCVGNFTAGGAGKTPVALKLASLLRQAGKEPAFLTRGYGGLERGPYLVNTSRDGAAAVGDEALLLARASTAVVSRRRPDGAKLLETLQAGMIIMDDGFQNPSLHKDFSLIVVDGVTGLGSGRVFPLGPLRAPLAFQMAKADAILVLGKGDTQPDFLPDLNGTPVFQAIVNPVCSPHHMGRDFVAFCGIGRPAKFFRTLQDAGISVQKEVGFPDHHPYSEADAALLLRTARENGAGLITTEKDHVRLAGQAGALQELYEATVPLPITVAFLDGGETSLMQMISAALTKRDKLEGCQG
jgi:tetraacyldisaccharide 4'-kinase